MILTKQEYEISKRQLAKMDATVKRLIGEAEELENSWATQNDAVLAKAGVEAHRSECDVLREQCEAYERKFFLTEQM